MVHVVGVVVVRQHVHTLHHPRLGGNKLRFHVLQSQMLTAAFAQVELTNGSKSMVSKPVAEKNGMFAFFEALEMEDDFAYDDKLWPWSED